MKGIVTIIYLAILILQIAALWKVFVKAGQPGWACIIPFYNIYVLMIVAGKPGWWFILTLIPLVNIIICIIASIAIAGNFGKGTGFGIGLVFLPFIFFPILAFTDAQYKSAAA